jgi:hypothetical protein
MVKSRFFCSFCGVGNENLKCEYIISENSSDPGSPCICAECIDLAHEIITKLRAQLDEIRRLGT